MLNSRPLVTMPKNFGLQREDDGVRLSCLASPAQSAWCAPFAPNGVIGGALDPAQLAVGV